MAQANIQFRLINTSVPFILYSIPTHRLQDPDKSYSFDCVPNPDWTLDYRSTKGVDIYAVYKLSCNNDPNADGCGGCFAQGHILIRAGNPNQQDPGFTDKFNTPNSRALLVAHELGHYLGIPGHRDDLCDNLMTKGLNGPNLVQEQINQTRNFIKSHGYNENK